MRMTRDTAWPRRCFEKNKEESSTRFANHVRAQVSQTAEALPVSVAQRSGTRLTSRAELIPVAPEEFFAKRSGADR